MSSDHSISHTAINSICDHFEDLWNAAPPIPEIAGFMVGVPPESRLILLHHLIAIDIEFRSRQNVGLEPIHYAPMGYDAFQIARRLLDARTKPDTEFHPPDASEHSDLDFSLQNLEIERNKATKERKQDPKRIGDYKLLQEIGDGGMGVVWMAEQLTPVRRRVAIKVIKAGKDTKQVIARFESERQSLAIMDHPNIAKVFDAGTTDNGLPYFVMELVKGIPFTEFCDKSKLNIKQRLQLFVPICKAIQHAHQKGIIHRDLKPSNVLVALYDGQPVPKVIDFGLAKAIGNESRLTEKTLFTEFGQIVGTLQYMSPEQAELNAVDVDTRTDIYSLGVMLYELLTGSTPIERNSLKNNAIHQILRFIREQDPPVPSTRLSASGDSLGSISQQRQVDSKRLQQVLRGELDWIVMKSLEKDRSRRYATANAFAEDITRYLNNQVVEAGPPTVLYRIKKTIHRHRGFALASLAVIFLLIAGIVSTSVGLGWALTERKRALSLALKATQESDRATASSLAAQDERNRAMIEEGKARQAQAIVEQNRKVIEANLARSHYLLANARWNSKRADQAIVFLNRVPHRPEFRKIEWNLTAHEFVGNELTLYGHFRGVDDVVFSPDGQIAASAGGDKHIRIWDAVSGREKSTLLVDKVEVHCLAFSSDGELLAAACSDSTIKIWEVKTGEMISTLIGHTDQVNSVAFSRDGLLLASGSQDCNAKIWDYKNKRVLFTFSGKNYPLQAIRFTPDSSRLIGLSNQKIMTWNISDGAEQNSFDTSDDMLLGFSVRPDGRELAVGNAKGNILIVDSQSGKLIKTLHGHSGPVRHVAFSADCSRLVSAGDDLSIRIRDANDYTDFGDLIGHSRPISGLDVSCDGSRVITSSFDNTVKSWHVSNRSDMKMIRGHDALISSIQYSPNGTQIATGSHDFTMRTWDPATSQMLTVFEGHTDRVQAIAFSPDGKLLASGSFDKTIKIWNAVNGTEVRTLSGHAGIVYGVAFSPNGKTIASVSRDRTVRLWDAERGIEMKVFSGHQLYIQAVAFSPDGKTLATASADMTIKIWDLTRGQELKTISGHDFVVTSLAFSPDGALLASGSEDSTCRLWDVNLGQEVHRLQGHTRFVNGVAFSPDGTRLASASSDGTMRIWDVDSGDELKKMSASTGHLTSVAFSPDGNFLASAGQDQVLVLWNGSSKLKARSLVGHEDVIADIMISGDGKQVFSIDRTGTRKSWDAQSGIELQSVEWPPPETAHRLSADKKWQVYSSANVGFIVDQEFEDQSWRKDTKEFNTFNQQQWHENQALDFEHKDNWYAATFHRAWIMKANPKQETAVENFELAYEKLLQDVQRNKQTGDIAVPNIVTEMLMSENFKNRHTELKTN